MIIKEKTPLAAGAQAITDIKKRFNLPGFSLKNIVIAMINMGHIAKIQELSVWKILLFNYKMVSNYDEWNLLDTIFNCKLIWNYKIL